MSALYLYLIKVALINALMLGFYHYAIRPGRNFKLMRVVLLLAIVLPLLLPLMPQLSLHRENIAVPDYVFSVPEIADMVVISPEAKPDLLLILRNSIYPAVAAVLLLGMLISVVSVIRKHLITGKKSTPYGTVSIDNTARSPYSFFRWVFFSEEGLLHPAANWLLKHEYSHVRHAHSFDRLLSAVFKSFLWFSPFAHFNNRLLAEVHEFQADAEAIDATGSKTEYTNLIVDFTGIPGQYHISNPFSAHLKKRMIMLNNLKPGKLSMVRILTGLTIITSVALFSSMIRPQKTSDNNGFTQQKQITGKETSIVKMTAVYDSPDEKIDAKSLGNLATIPPAFPGGDEARITFFRNNINYPAIALEKKIQGTVLYRITIEISGKVTNPTIEKGIGEGCDEEVLRVVQMMPDWIPGNVNGEPVKVEMVLPVSFILSESKTGKIEDQKYVFHRVPNESIIDKPDMQNDPVKKNNSNNNDVFTVVENPPKFTGGEEARMAYMQKAISYPEQAKKNKIEGTVYVTFVVEKDGQIRNAKILRGIGGGCDEVALKAIQNMPPWSPGKQKGEAVRVQFNMPVKFSLSDGKAEKPKELPITSMINGREIYNIVDEKPEYPGGVNAFLSHIKNGIGKEVEIAPSNDINEMILYTSFIVEIDGSISNISTANEAYEAYEYSSDFREAIKKMPAWKPGRKDGKSVPTSVRISLRFKSGNEK